MPYWTRLSETASYLSHIWNFIMFILQYLISLDCLMQRANCLIFGYFIMCVPYFTRLSEAVSHLSHFWNLICSYKLNFTRLPEAASLVSCVWILLCSLDLSPVYVLKDSSIAEYLLDGLGQQRISPEFWLCSLAIPRVILKRFLRYFKKFFYFTSQFSYVHSHSMWDCDL
jgi:hypothetical protein